MADERQVSAAHCRGSHRMAAARRMDEATARRIEVDLGTIGPRHGSMCCGTQVLDPAVSAEERSESRIWTSDAALLERSHREYPAGRERRHPRVEPMGREVECLADEAIELRSRRILKVDEGHAVLEAGLFRVRLERVVGCGGAGRTLDCDRTGV